MGRPQRPHKRTSVKRTKFLAGRGIGKNVSRPNTKPMTKVEMKKIERIARSLMIESDKQAESLSKLENPGLSNLIIRYEYRIYNKLEKLGFTSMSRKKLPDLYYSIFEDANYHLLTKALITIDAFYSKSPWLHDSDYKRYLKAGGRTWRL